ncbi:MAG: DUF1622 domain-containing protein [Pseudomonadota bacterium]
MTEATRENSFEATLHMVATGAEALGVLAIIIGAVFACYLTARTLMDGADGATAYRTFRRSLAQGILLGLEFLVAADIIGTVAIEPSLQNLGNLAIIVAIRTFLSWSLELEIEGRWPWQKSTSQPNES